MTIVKIFMTVTVMSSWKAFNVGWDGPHCPRHTHAISERHVDGFRGLKAYQINMRMRPCK
jgi:hypothetical protein